METLEKEDDDTKQELRERDDVRRYYSSFDSPLCNMFHQFVKSLIKCFCHEETSSNGGSEEPLDPNNEENVDTASLRRRPPRSDLSTGSGGQTN